jgi:hypothetical protein
MELLARTADSGYTPDEADLIVVDRHPLDDINAVSDVLPLVNDGKSPSTM